MVDVESIARLEVADRLSMLEGSEGVKPMEADELLNSTAEASAVSTAEGLSVESME